VPATWWRALRRTLCAVLGSLVLCHCGASGPGVHHEVIRYGQFEHVRLYRPAGPPRQLVLLLSGDGGWGADLDELARRLTLRGALVAGIDVGEWLDVLEHAQTSCVAPGAYLAALATHLAGEPPAIHAPPLLIGHSAGASLAYVALAQSRAREFAGALTLAFCADLDLRQPLCPGGALRTAMRRDGQRLLPGGALPARWITLHGLEDEECPEPDARAFADAVPGARFIPLPEVGHAYRDWDLWWSPFITSYEALASPGTP